MYPSYCCSKISSQDDLYNDLDTINYDLEVTNLVISPQITIGLSLNLVHMYKYINEDDRIFSDGASLLLHL